jgi:hypothetical protein
LPAYFPALLVADLKNIDFKTLVIKSSLFML